MRNKASIPNLLLGLLIAGLAAMALHTVAGVGGPGLDGVVNDGLYNALMLGSALLVLSRAVVVERQRSAWLAMGAGVLFWSLGELYYSMFIEGTSAEAVGTVSPADALFLTMYPCFYLGLGWLAKDRLRRLPVGVWFDGLIAGLAAATVAAALILPPIIDRVQGSVGSAIVSSAYPIGDLLLLLFAVGALGVSGWRPGRVWMMIAASMLVSVIADSDYLYQTATGSFSENSWISCLWPASAILIALAAWTPAGQQRKPRATKGWETVSAPTLGLLSAVGVLAYGNLAHQIAAPVLALALATLLAVGTHLILTMRENLALLASSEQLSLTDPLTGLGNRRRLLTDLRVACVAARDDSPWRLIIYDLDGFKRYNDSFGHPAGDALLTQLSDRLAQAVAPQGIAYRMGGDEFCVLVECGVGCEKLIEDSLMALSDQGPGFAVSASHGAVAIPTEASDPAAAIQLADQRLYRRKEELAARKDSADAEHGEQALAAWQGDRDLVANAGAEQRPGDGRVGRDASLGGRSVA